VAAAALGLAALGLLAWSTDVFATVGLTLLWSMPVVALLAAIAGDLPWYPGRRGPLLRERRSAFVREARDRPWRLLFVIWALLMIPAPLFPERFASFAYASTGALTLGVLLLSFRRFGALRTLLLFTVAFSFGVAIEVIGERTGFPFGSYSYRESGLALLGVPLLVPLGWYALTLIAIAVAPRTPLGTRFIAPLALVVWDVGLDPLMVLKGFWVFEVGPYFGVPWSNFLGWGAAGWLLVALLVRLEPRLAVDPLPDLRPLYLVQAFLISVGLAFFGLPLAGGIAGVLMVTLYALAARARTGG
jgi:putative membrane protein